MCSVIGKHVCSIAMIELLFSENTSHVSDSLHFTYWIFLRKRTSVPHKIDIERTNIYFIFHTNSRKWNEDIEIPHQSASYIVSFCTRELVYSIIFINRVVLIVSMNIQNNYIFSSFTVYLQISHS